MRMENLCISDERWTIRPDVCIGVMATRHKCTIASLSRLRGWPGTKTFGEVSRCVATSRAGSCLLPREPWDSGVFVYGTWIGGIPLAGTVDGTSDRLAFSCRVKTHPEGRYTPASAERAVLRAPPSRGAIPHTQVGWRRRQTYSPDLSLFTLRTLPHYAAHQITARIPAPMPTTIATTPRVRAILALRAVCSCAIART
jgi:hypothetical protein